jgi:hypothetical protein
MSRGFPRLVERFPASSDEFCRWRFHDTFLDELCNDYERVLGALDTQRESLTAAGSVDSSWWELKNLALKLEQEFLERLANHAASEHKKIEQNNNG